MKLPLLPITVTSPPNPITVLKQLPRAVLKSLPYVPFLLHRQVLDRVLKHIFKEALNDGELDCLKHRWLKIEITDVKLQWLFSCGSQRDIEIKKEGPADVCIKGPLKSFILLAAQKEDPDTLFFQRDLIIEGDTDLGLQIKNLLDSIDVNTLPAEIIFTLRACAEYMTLFPNNSLEII